MASGTNLNETTLQGTATGTLNEHSAAIALTIAYHPQLERICERVLLNGPNEPPLALSRAQPDFAEPGVSHGKPLSEASISRTPIHLDVQADGSVVIDMGESNTSVTICGQTVKGKVKLSTQDISSGVALTLGKRVVLLLHSIPPLDDVLAALDSDIAPELVGTSVGMRRVLLEIRNVADTDKHVLLRGETGSGKELVAQAIHRASRRQGKPFVPVNVAAVSRELAVAEFFGAVKGSHSLALTNREGYFEKASFGTLFLDEIGDIPGSLQPTLLRALQDGEIQPVGAEKPRKVNVRIISATDANLEAKIAAAEFRDAFHQRLRGYEIWIPPLRERREDIGLLFARFLQEELAAIGESHRLEIEKDEGKPWLPASIVAQLIDYDWPGNVRELKNTVGQIVIGNRGRPRVELPASIDKAFAVRPARVRLESVEKVAPAAAPVLVAEPALPEPLPRRKPADVKENELRDALRECRWELNATAQKLGISRAGIYTLKPKFSWFRMAGDLKIDELQRCHEVCHGNLREMSERLEVSEDAIKRRIKDLGLELKLE